MEVYKLNENYFKGYFTKGKLLERVKSKRFLIRSKPDQYGAVRVLDLLNMKLGTYHESFLSTDTFAQDTLLNDIMTILASDIEVDLTKANGFTQAREKQALSIIKAVDKYINELLRL